MALVNLFFDENTNEWLQDGNQFLNEEDEFTVSGTHRLNGAYWLYDDTPEGDEAYFDALTNRGLVSYKVEVINLTTNEVEQTFEYSINAIDLYGGEIIRDLDITLVENNDTYEPDDRPYKIVLSSENTGTNDNLGVAPGADLADYGPTELFTTVRDGRLTWYADWGGAQNPVVDLDNLVNFGNAYNQQTIWIGSIENIFDRQGIGGTLKIYRDNLLFDDLVFSRDFDYSTESSVQFTPINDFTYSDLNELDANYRWEWIPNLVLDGDPDTYEGTFYINTGVERSDGGRRASNEGTQGDLQNEATAFALTSSFGQSNSSEGGNTASNFALPVGFENLPQISDIFENIAWQLPQTLVADGRVAQLLGLGFNFNEKPDQELNSVTPNENGDFLGSRDSASPDLLTGTPENALYHGFKGADVLIGGPGDDEMRGGVGADFLDGGEDNDNLFSGAGLDTLIGGPGSDLFNLGGGFNVLPDFSIEDALRTYGDLPIEWQSYKGGMLGSYEGGVVYLPFFSAPPGFDFSSFG